MGTIDDLHTLVRLLNEFNLPVSPILEYAIKEKMEELELRTENRSAIGEATPEYVMPKDKTEDEESSIFIEKISQLIGNAVRERRKEKGLTLQELARQSHVSYGTIVNIEKCHKLPTFSIISNVLLTLNLKFEYIVKSSESVSDYVLCGNNERQDINIGDVIRERRTEVGVSLEVLARNAKVSYHTIQNIERGKNLPTLNVVLKILDELNIEIRITERI